MKKVLIASDHAGIRVKKFLLSGLASLKVPHEDFSPVNNEGDDYPDYASKVVSSLTNKKIGVLVCGSGIGMSIAANKHKGVRAALCRTPRDAELSRKHNDANVLVLSGKTSKNDAVAILKKFLRTDFEKGRHLRRVKKIGAFEK